ncbi:MAG: prefoldin subunit alpha [Candidatus Lokiarchaeota archaeon]|nr:prefoldin subunit alpha [Candidatus Lokiarchaeota archaeon]
MENPQNSQELAYQFQYIKEQKDMYMQNLEIVNASYTNLIKTKNTIKNLKDIKDGEEILVPVGGMISIKALIKEPQKILLSISNDVMVESNINNSIEYIDKLIDQHKNQMSFLQEQIKKIEANLLGISQKFQQDFSQQR